MLITDGRKVVEIEIRTTGKNGRNVPRDITAQLILNDEWRHDNIIGMWIIDDVDYCISQVKDIMNGKGDWTNEDLISDAELTINPITQKTNDFSVSQLIGICHLARNQIVNYSITAEELDMYTEIEDIATSILLGN